MTKLKIFIIGTLLATITQSPAMQREGESKPQRVHGISSAPDIFSAGSPEKKLKILEDHKKFIQQKSLSTECFIAEQYSSPTLYEAVAKMNEDQIDALLKENGDPLLSNPKMLNDTPLHAAVISIPEWKSDIFIKKSRILDRLLEKIKAQGKKDINVANKFGNTPLMRLLDNRQTMSVDYRIAIAQKLLDAGANPLIENTFKKNGIMLARECECELVENNTRIQQLQKK